MSLLLLLVHGVRHLDARIITVSDIGEIHVLSVLFRGAKLLFFDEVL